MNRLTLGLLATFVAILLGSGLLAYVLRDRPAADTKASAARSENPSSSPNTGETPQAETEKQGKKGSHPLLWELFGPDASGLSPASYASWEATASRILLRFSLAAFLAALLAFRPRRGISFSRRNPFVAQTQILMAVGAERKQHLHVSLGKTSPQSRKATLMITSERPSSIVVEDAAKAYSGF